MKCPSCKTADMESHDLEEGLISKHCLACDGHWLPSFQYWLWLQQHGDNLPERPAAEGAALTVTESEQAKTCPECGHILTHHRVGHGLDFSLDRCGHCGGVWFDKNEWEILKSRNLHDDVHFVFSQVWQSEVAKQERAKMREQRLLAHFGTQDLAEIRRIKAWLDGHPRKNELYAFLLNPEA